MTPGPPSLSVQTVFYHNDQRLALRALDAIANAVRYARSAGSIGDWSLVIGDCGDSATLDDSAASALAAAVARCGGEFDYQIFGANLGTAAGHNRLAQRSSSDLMLILNPDGTVGFNLVDVLAAEFRSRVGIAEARQLPFEHPKHYHPDTGQTSWASTACAMTSRSVFDRVAGFDAETFFLYCDDVDYSWRVRLAGYDVVYQPAARFFHDKRLTLECEVQTSDAEDYYSAEAALLLAYKYSRRDVLTEIRRLFGATDREYMRRALASFDQRVADGRLPMQIDPHHTVAQFTEGGYAVKRY